jgi:hypothetical protein
MYMCVCVRACVRARACMYVCARARARMYECVSHACMCVYVYACVYVRIMYVCVCVYACMFARERINRFAPNMACLLLETVKRL